MLIRIVMDVNSSIDIKKVEAVIRLFLIRLDNLDRKIDTSLIPTWIRQYNNLCLLNIPNIMKKYSTMRNVWEGGVDGESYLRIVKSHLRSGMVHDWKSWVLTNLLKDGIYKEWKSDNINVNYIAKESKIYPTKIRAKESFRSGRPISGVSYNGIIYQCYRSKGCIYGRKIQLINPLEKEYGQVYYTLKLDKSKPITLDPNKSQYVGILLLPMLIKEGYPLFNKDIKYVCIRSDWSI
jgi:hypothetical protein